MTHHQALLRNTLILKFVDSLYMGFPKSSPTQSSISRLLYRLPWEISYHESHGLHYQKGCAKKLVRQHELVFALNSIWGHHMITFVRPDAKMVECDRKLTTLIASPFFTEALMNLMGTVVGVARCNFNTYYSSSSQAKMFSDEQSLQ